MFRELRAQGFEVRGGKITAPEGFDKDRVRILNEMAVSRGVEKAKRNLLRHEDRLLGYLADGSTLDPARIEPRLVEVGPRSEEELLFRWARLHWSVPTAAGYGRRLRFLVVDDSNEKLIGLIGLGDGVFSQRARDEWIGWDRKRRQTALRSVMHAHILGAVPPYSHLLGGKLVAMLATATEVREAFSARYAGRKTLIAGDSQDGQLALVTTTGALGRSSVYNRLRYRAKAGDPGRRVFTRVGYTYGSAQAHFGDGLYAALESYATRHCKLSPKRPSWGRGFRSRREVIDKALTHLGFDPGELTYGLSREVWCAPLGENSNEFLRGDEHRLKPYRDTAAEMSGFWRERWLLPRMKRDRRHETFSPSSWRLWDD